MGRDRGEIPRSVPFAVCGMVLGETGCVFDTSEGYGGRGGVNGRGGETGFKEDI